MKRELTAVVCVVMLQACAQASALKSRDTSPTSTFNGAWTATMKSTASPQSSGSRRYECEPFTEPFFIRVQKGIVSGYLQTDENFSFRTTLDSFGVFNTIIPIESYYRYKPNSAVEHSTIALLLSGDLSADSLRGRFVIADTRMDLQGCVTEVVYVAL